MEVGAQIGGLIASGKFKAALATTLDVKNLYLPVKVFYLINFVKLQV